MNITIHRALAELKLLEKRIDKEIRGASFCVAARNTETKLNGTTVEEYKINSQAALDSISDMIKRRDSIKNAIAKLNATTIVIINGKEYTVAEAIWMNQQGIDSKKQLLAKLQEQYSYAVTNMDTFNARLADKADEAVLRMMGSDSKDTKAVKSDDFIKMKESYMNMGSWSMFSGFDIKKKIDELQTEIDIFTAEVDAALSTSNATTMIDIPD